MVVVNNGHSGNDNNDQQVYYNSSSTTTINLSKNPMHDDEEESSATTTAVAAAASPLLMQQMPTLPQQPQPPIATRVEFANLLLLPLDNKNTLPISNGTTTGTANTTTSCTDRDDHELLLLQQQQQLHEEVVVVLQARIETCQGLVAAATATAADSQSSLLLPSLTNHHHHHSSHFNKNNNTSNAATTANNNMNLNATSQLQLQPPPQQLQQQLLSPMTQIQGVVDLDVLSTIAGVSRSDLVPDWQQQPSQQQQQQSSSSSVQSVVGTMNDSVAVATGSVVSDDVEDRQYRYDVGHDVSREDENDIVEVDRIMNEGTPLLSLSPVLSSSSSSVLYHHFHQQHPEVVPYTLSPSTSSLMNNNNNNNHPHYYNHHHDQHIIITDTVLLNADAFVETLTDVLDVVPHNNKSQQQPSNHYHANDTDDIDDDDDNDIESMTQEDDGDLTTNFDDVSGVTPGGAFFVPRPENLGANLRSNRQHAFLLEIPPLPGPSHHRSTTTNNTTNYHSTTNSISSSDAVPSHFILAFPQRDGSGLWQDDVSDASNDNNNNNNDNDSDSFLMGLTHLPTDVCDVQIEAIQYNDTETIRLDVVVKRQVPVVGYVILIGGLLALSSVGTALNLQQNVSPIMKSFWRYTSTWIVLFPIAIRSLQHSSNGYPQLSRTQWTHFFICSFCYALMTSAFVTALEYTTLANAFVLSNLAPLFIIVGRIVLGYGVLYMEGIGAMIGFIGGTICTLDQNPTRDVNGHIHDHPKALLGDSIAVMASAAVAIYLLLAKKLRPHLDLFVFTFLLMFISSIYVLLYMVITNEPMSFSNHIDYGLWGWTNWHWNRLPLELYLAIVCNIMGTTGYIAVMKYFEPIVVSTVMLSEPVLGALMASVVGSDSLPGLQTWIGNIVVAVGIFLVVWSGARSTETIDATKALLQVNNNNTSDHDHHNNTVTTNAASYDRHHNNRSMKNNSTKTGTSSAGVPLLKNHPVKAALNSPHRLCINGGGGGRMRGESM